MNLCLYEDPRSGMLTVGKTHRLCTVLGVMVDGFGTTARVFYLVVDAHGDDPRVVNARRVSLYVEPK